MADAPDLDDFIAGVDVVVYATGLDWLADRVGPNQQAFEYRHAPDTTFIQNHILPLLDTMRAGGVTKETP